SWAAAGMLAPVTEVHYGEEGLLRLNLDSARRWPGFAHELAEAAGRDVGYRTTGTLAVARDNDDKAALDELYDFQRKLGLEVQRLRGRDCRQLEPGLARRVRGGILVEGDHQVDNRLLVEALGAACASAGVERRRARVEEIEISGGAVESATLSGGERIACGRIVIAAGCWSGQIKGVPGELVAVRPVKGQLLHLRGPRETPLATRTIRGLDVYVVPRDDGRVVVGATVEERGFDATVTAGAAYELLRDAYELLPGVTELELVEAVAGLRPGTPDNAPLLGESGIEGLVLATGHYRNGILLTPLTADAIGDLLVEGRAPEAIEPFSPRRFASAGVGG
ncbi:MAG: glycine oxidase ThiO, partial [Actinomycetota bacterium]